MNSPSGPLAGAGTPRRREKERALAARVGSWLAWWVLLMALWIILDWSLDVAELLVGAGVAAAGAVAAELVGHQTDSHFRVRIRWLIPLLGLPGQVLRDTVIVFAALGRLLIRGEQPASGFVEVPKVWGDESTEGISRRVLLMGGTSVAPNTFVLGMDRERDVMVVHYLVLPTQRAAR
ncbi:MAG: Na+/H+ antiporter subunit E [Pseudonocardiaceae bacterium]